MIKRKVFLFANTLWFINRFKSSLILDLLKRNYEVNIIYFRKGPIKDLENLNINKYSIKIQNFINFFIDQYLKIPQKNHTINILLSFTIGPIILSSLPFRLNY